MSCRVPGFEGQSFSMSSKSGYKGKGVIDRV